MPIAYRPEIARCKGSCLSLGQQGAHRPFVGNGNGCGVAPAHPEDGPKQTHEHAGDDRDGCGCSHLLPARGMPPCARFRARGRDGQACPVQSIGRESIAGYKTGRAFGKPGLPESVRHAWWTGVADLAHADWPRLRPDPTIPPWVWRGRVSDEGHPPHRSSSWIVVWRDDVCAMLAGCGEGVTWQAAREARAARRPMRPRVAPETGCPGRTPRVRQASSCPCQRVARCRDERAFRRSP